VIGVAGGLGAGRAIDVLAVKGKPLRGRYAKMPWGVDSDRPFGAD
jgi:hypothetical protein